MRLMKNWFSSMKIASANDFVELSRTRNKFSNEGHDVNTDPI